MSKKLYIFVRKGRFGVFAGLLRLGLAFLAASLLLLLACFLAFWWQDWGGGTGSLLVCKHVVFMYALVADANYFGMEWCLRQCKFGKK